MKRCASLALLLLFAASAEGHRGRGAATSGGGGGGAAPTNVQVILEGQTGPNVIQNNQCASVTASCPGWTSTYTIHFLSSTPNSNEQIGWENVVGASSYNIYRSVNGASYSLLANVTDSTATTNYSSYLTNQGSFAPAAGINRAYTDTTATGVQVISQYPPVQVTASMTSGSNVLTVTAVNNNTSTGTPGVINLHQGIGGPGIPVGTTISSFGSGTGGTGTYNLSANATANETAQKYGTNYFPVTSYTYYATAVTGGVESAASPFAYIPFITNGQFICSSGVFNGNVTTGATAPATTPLGLSNALQWSVTPSFALINPFSGNCSPSQVLNVAGYNFISISFYTTTSGVNLTEGTETGGDNNLTNLIALSTWGPTNLVPSTWTTYKIPLNALNTDAQFSGSGIQVGSYYKTTWVWNGTATVYVEASFSVN